jgi:hypothetical protein
MNPINYQLYDVVELKKEHPCNKRSKIFQIVRLGADIKIMCLGCGNIIMLDRDAFNHRIKKVIEHRQEIIKL